MAVFYLQSILLDTACDFKLSLEIASIDTHTLERDTRKKLMRTSGRCLPGFAGALMQLTLTVSPEALEDLGSLCFLELPGANIVSQDSCTQKHGARCPLHLPFHSWVPLFLQHLDPAGAPQEGARLAPMSETSAVAIWQLTVQTPEGI